jgi:uncharacterized protein (TIGR02231 family)
MPAPSCAAAPMSMARCEDAGMALDDDEAALFDSSAYVEPVVQSARVQEGATAMTFTVDNHLHTVTNDDKPTRVTLTVVPVRSAVSYVTRPKLTETVFAQMKATNLSEFTLLAGPALVFCGQQFVAKTQLERVSPGDSFKVNLGSDNDVTVKYRKVRHERQEIGNFMTGRRIRYSILTHIVVNNRKRAAISIVVEDQLPVSQHEDIEVTMVNPPRPAEDTPEHQRLRTGLLQWELQLAPQQEHTIPIEFTVQHPEAFSMEGL